MDRYRSSLNEDAANAYGDIAKEVRSNILVYLARNSFHNNITKQYKTHIMMKAGMTPTELALSWVYHREHVASTIIGATTIEQLKEDIKAYDIKLDEDTLEKITKVYKKYTDPTKSYGA